MKFFLQVDHKISWKLSTIIPHFKAFWSIFRPLFTQKSINTYRNPYNFTFSWNAKINQGCWHKIHSIFINFPYQTSYHASWHNFTPHYLNIFLFLPYDVMRWGDEKVKICVPCCFICNFIIESGKVSDFRKLLNKICWGSILSLYVVFTVIGSVKKLSVEKMGSVADETTPIVPIGDPGSLSIK